MGHLRRNSRGFEPGKTVITSGASCAFEEAKLKPKRLLSRHLACDWGDISPEDAKANDEALESGERLFSSYFLPTGKTIWVITEADRSATTILSPEEY